MWASGVSFAPWPDWKAAGFSGRSSAVTQHKFKFLLWTSAVTHHQNFAVNNANNNFAVSNSFFKFFSQTSAKKQSGICKQSYLFAKFVNKSMCTDFEFCVPDFEFWTGKKLDLGEDLPRSPSTSYIIHRPDDLFLLFNLFFAYLIATAKKT